MPVDLQLLLPQVNAELAAASSPYLSMELNADQALVFLGVLQLAMRHPDLPPAMRELTRQLAETIETQLSACGPAVRSLCALSGDATTYETSRL
jgi:hypothetical protein